MKKATYFIAFCLIVLASGCTNEPVMDQDYETINKSEQKIKINSIENEEVKDSDI